MGRRRRRSHARDRRPVVRDAEQHPIAHHGATAADGAAADAAAGAADGDADDDEEEREGHDDGLRSARPRSPRRAGSPDVASAIRATHGAAPDREADACRTARRQHAPGIACSCSSFVIGRPRQRGRRRVGYALLRSTSAAASPARWHRRIRSASGWSAWFAWAGWFALAPAPGRSSVLRQDAAQRTRLLTHARSADRPG